MYHLYQHTPETSQCYSVSLPIYMSTSTHTGIYKKITDYTEPRSTNDYS